MDLTTTETPFRALLVEDSADDTFLLLREMRKGGFCPEVTRLDQLDAVAEALEQEWDLLLCDYNLPGFTALEVLRLVQARRPELPVIIVSGAIGEESAVEALHAGARDYIMKDNLSRLNPAIRRELKELDLYRQRQQAEEARQEVEEHFRQLAGNIEGVLWLVDCDHNQMIYISSAYEQIWERSPEPLLADPNALLDTIHPEDYSRIQLLLEQEGWPGFNGDYRIVRPDGSTRWINTHTFPIHDQSGRAYRCAGLSRDVTERKLLELERRKLSRALEQTADSVMITDCGGCIEYVNPAFESVTGYAREEVLGQRPSLLSSGLHDREFFAQLWKTVLNGVPFHEIFINRRKDGDLYYEAKTITPVRDEHGDVTHFIATGKDITENLRRRQADRRLALYDETTGLPSRVLFLDRLTQGLRQAQLLVRGVAVLAVSFDLAGIIGEGGDPVRAALVQGIASRLSEGIKGSGHAARLEGDEFTLMLRGVESRAQVEGLALRLAEAFKRPLEAVGYELYAAPRIGISLFPEHGSTAEALLDKARTAMGYRDDSSLPFHFYTPGMRPVAGGGARRAN